MLETTLGQLWINSVLPEDLVDHDRVLDKKGIRALLQEVADKHPDKYREVAKRLSDIGRDASFSEGGYSFGLKSLRQSLAGRQMRMKMQKELDKIYSSNMSDEQKDTAVLLAVQKYQGQLHKDVLQESKDEGNPLAMQVQSGSRGNSVNLNSLRGADLLYTDHRGNALPIPVLRSYSMGLKPYEYFAGAFGARKGIQDLKSATQDAGFLAKQLVQATHRLLVTSDDDDDPYDESTPRGLPVNTNDSDTAGSLLAHPIGGYKRNTVLTPKILKELEADGIDEILVRSPTVGGPQDGGVYARDLGYRERGGLSPIGDYVGIAAAQALAEPITQAQISSKHSGGVAGAGAGAISGFQFINQLVQVPKKFAAGAAHAQLDGTVHSVREAPQGGHYVHIGNEDHYVGHGYELKVKKGDTVEAGDVISEGIPNPAEVVKHKGVGEGRRYFVKAFRDTLDGMGTRGHRRNIELLSRGLINHVRLTEEMGDWVQDDVVPYQLLERQWKPREGHAVITPNQAAGKYLERPVLHYSVGTKIQPSMVKHLQKHGVRSIYAHTEPPPFQPEMIRGMSNAAHDPDWMTRMLGSYQKNSLLEGARRGAVSDEGGTSYVPALAHGAGFGEHGATQGWKDLDTNKTTP